MFLAPLNEVVDVCKKLPYITIIRDYMFSTIYMYEEGDLLLT